MKGIHNTVADAISRLDTIYYTSTSERKEAKLDDPNKILELCFCSFRTLQ
jgi:hypothetical protein